MRACLLPLLATVLAAQADEPAEHVAAAEREPRTRIERTVHELLPSLVKVHGASGLATIGAYATGIVVSEQGHVLTLDQIMIQKGKTRVVLHDGSVHDAQLLPEEPRLGVRLLRIDPQQVQGGLRPLWPPAGDEGAFRTGQFVVSIGNAFRLAEFAEKMSATFGTVVGRANTALRHRLADVQYDGDLILTDACNNPGHQGGGLFTLDGRWIGLNLRLLDSKETNTMLSAAIPTRDLLPYLEQHVLGRTRPETVVERVPAWTGIVLFEQAGRESPPAYVERVVPGSPAAELGLRPDDLIVRIDDWSVRTCREFRDVLARCAAGQVVKLVWKRGTRVLDGELRLGEPPK
ncbi:MAG: trypsin-like peptidase domain-containing protein [Planctomycetes bacterium]|nr:trypsin-like peptidase domain-containing protein [Planctomycetota bacterium]